MPNKNPLIEWTGSLKESFFANFCDYDFPFKGFKVLYNSKYPTLDICNRIIITKEPDLSSFDFNADYSKKIISFQHRDELDLAKIKATLSNYYIEDELIKFAFGLKEAKLVSPKLDENISFGFLETEKFFYLDEFNKKNLNDYYTHASLDEMKNFDEEFINSHEAFKKLVMIKDDKIVAAATIYMHEGLVYFYDFCVDKEFRDDKNLRVNFFIFFANLFKQYGFYGIYTEVLKSDKSLCKFYKELGFQKFDSEPVLIRK